MKKFAKMSLVAAIAVAGFTSSASAADLEQAIKGVDISGKVRYRMEDSNFLNDQTEDQDVNIDVTLKVPVTDNVTFVAHANLDNDDQGDDKALAGAGDLNLENYYFQYVTGATTVNVGTQEIPGRLTDGLAAEGIVGLYNAGSFTVGAAAFYNSEATSQSLYSVIAMGSVGPVSLLGQYAVAEDLLSTYNLKADATFGPVTAGLEYVDTDMDDDDDELNTFKAYVSGKIDIVTATLAYASTGEDGSGSIDHATETSSEFLLWQMGSGNVLGKTTTRGIPDLDAWALDVSAAVTDDISIRLAYADGEATAADTDLTETLGQVSYKMAKNLSTYIRYSQFEVDSEDYDRGRIEIKYTF